MDLNLIHQELIENIIILLRQYKKIYSTDELKILTEFLQEWRKKNFSDFSQLFFAFKKIRFLFGKLWHYEITDVHNYTEGENFKFVVTVPVGKLPENLNALRRNVISASLITDKHMGTFNKINYGFICEVDKDNFIAAGSDDLNVVCTVEDLNLEQGYFKVDELNGINIYCKKIACFLETPKQIEFINLKNGLEKNGQMLSTEKSAVYSDIILDAQKTKFKAIFKITPCSKEVDDIVEEMRNMYGLEVISIPLDIYQIKYGVLNKEESYKKKLYDLTNLEFLKKIFSLDFSADFFDSNLILEKVSNVLKVIDSETNNYIYYNYNNKRLDLALQNISCFYTILQKDDGSFQYYIDNIEVTEEEFNFTLTQRRKL